MSDVLIIAGNIRVALRRSARARRMTLRVPRLGGDVVLTLPRSTPLAEGQAFAESKAEWLRQASARQTPPEIVGAGTVIPIEGTPVTITPFPILRPRIENHKLLVPQVKPAGPVVQAFLRHLAHQRLTAASTHYADQIGQNYRSISLRDTRSRWGSCSTEKRLMFSWRLIMAPPEVLNYVAAHEVAHLVHMDHSPRFWSEVEKLMPGYQQHRNWLREHGNALLAWKFTS